ncbi:hypothetical protein [Geomicrobium sp. JCM 19037]
MEGTSVNEISTLLKRHVKTINSYIQTYEDEGMAAWRCNLCRENQQG